MLRIKCSVCRVEHRVVEQKDVEGTKKGEERERETVGENVARGFAWLCSIILLLYLLCLRHGRKKVEKEGRKNDGADTLLLAGKNFSRANMIVEMRFAFEITV